MDLSQHSKIIKALLVIPFAMGILTFAEAFMPMETVENVVTSKKSNYRLKTNSTTYTINFKNINDQFTQEIYEAFNEDDEVVLHLTAFNKQIKAIELKKTNQLYSNDTGEELALYAFGFVFLLTGLAWLKYGNLNHQTAMILLFITLIAIIQGVRML